MYIHTFIYPPFHASTYLSIHPSTYLSIHPSTYLSIHSSIHPSTIYLSAIQVPENLTVSDLKSACGNNRLPVVLTPAIQQCLDVFRPWLSGENTQPFLLVGPEGCGKELVLRHSFEQLKSAQVATVHCSAQTTAAHVIQKLAEVCLVISSNTGRVYRPRDTERLIVYLKDINLPKPDKWGTSQLIAFLQQASHCHSLSLSLSYSTHLILFPVSLSV